MSAFSRLSSKRPSFSGSTPRIRPRVGRERRWRARTRVVGGREGDEGPGEGFRRHESHECRSTFVPIDPIPPHVSLVRHERRDDLEAVIIESNGRLLEEDGNLFLREQVLRNS